MALRAEGDEEAWAGRFIRVIRRHFRDRDGQLGVWELVVRRTHGPIVAVAAVTERHELLVNRIWRVPLGAYTLELPAGLMDQAGEEPEACAQRELLEETGYRADRLERLMAGPFNAGMTPDELWVYLGWNARRVAAPQPEPTEDMEILPVPLRELMGFLQAPPPDTRVDIKLFGVIPFLQARFPAAF